MLEEAGVSLPQFSFSVLRIKTPGIAVLSALLRLGSGRNLCLKNQREFGSQLRTGFGTEGQRTDRFHATWNR